MEDNKKIPGERSAGVLLNLEKDIYFLFGGGNRDQTFNDSWLIKVLEGETLWEELSLNKYIQARFGSSAISINNNIYIHGGQNYLESKFYGDFYQMQIKEKRVEIIKNHTIYPFEIDKFPCERNSHSIAYYQNKIYLFGGGNGQGLLNDLWSFDIDKSVWNKHLLSGNEIKGREMHGMVCYNNYLYIFGGRLYEEIDKNLFRIDLNNFECNLFKQIPIPMCSFTYCLYKNFIIIYGGTDGNIFLKDIIIYNINNNKWAKSKYHPKIDESAFGGKISSMMAHDEDNLIIFGGSFLHRDSNEVFLVSLIDLLNENNLSPC